MTISSHPPAPSAADSRGARLSAASGAAPWLATSKTNTRPAARAPHRGRQRGFTLIEVMVASFILAVMTLGSLSLHQVTLASAVGSDNRAYAERMSEEFMQFYTAFLLGNAPASVLTNFAFDDSGTPFAGTCDATTMIAGDVGVSPVLSNFLTCWRARLRDELPNGRATTSFPGNPATNPELEVRIFWGAGGATKQIALIVG